MRERWLALALAALVPAAVAQTAPATTGSAAVVSPLDQRIAQLVGLFGGAVAYDDYFAPSFQAAIPKAQFDSVRAQLIATAGRPLSIASVTPTGPWQADVVVTCDKTAMTVRIAVDPAEPHRVTGLAVTGFTAPQATPKAVVTAIAELHGQTSFGFYRLTAAGPVLIDGLNETRPLAIGSAFKLVVLAELVRAIEARERRWSDTIVVDGRPLPGGAYAQLSAGTKLTLQDVATKMIQVSDNSATDLLIRTLGRDKVEAMLPVIGVAPDRRNRPWLTTLEMFKLKGVDGLAPRYLALGTDARRRMLDGSVAAIPLSAIPPTLFQDNKPLLIDQLEWFESPADLARVHDWLRRHTALGTPAAPARAILALNPGMPPDVTARWRYVGYKGGSEPGVLALSWLLEGKDGQAYVLAVSWNDPAAPVDLATLTGLANRYAALVAP